MSERIGDWFLTSTGKKFYPLDARPEDICIEDIAHALGNVCRFGGHCKQFYSVAQHSIVVAENVPEHLAGIALLHDATEAYVGDMVRPLKRSMPNFALAKDRLWEVIAARFGLPLTNPRDFREIKNADNRALMTERRDVMIESNHRWSLTEEYPPYERAIVPWNPIISRSFFLTAWLKLTKA